MNDQSRTYGQMTLPGFDEFIGSPASVAGSTLCSLPDGQKIDQSGPEAVHVSPIRVPVNKKAKRTNETCGQKCSGSSASVALSASLANKCRTLLDTVGSIEFRQTWKEKATPLFHAC